MRLANQGVRPVGADHQVGVVQFCEVAHHVAVDQMGPNRQRALAQDLDQAQTGDRGEPDPIDADAFPMHAQFDVAPLLEARGDERQRLRISRAEELERFIGEHHAEAEGRMRVVLLVDRHVGIGQFAPDAVGGVQAGRASTQDLDLHLSIPFISWLLRARPERRRELAGCAARAGCRAGVRPTHASLPPPSATRRRAGIDAGTPSTSRRPSSP